MRLRQFISTSACAIVLVFCVAHATHAEQQPADSRLALGVSPAITELILEPGEPKELRITVTNLTNEALPVKGTAGAFRLNEEVVEKDRAIFDASLWIRLAQPDFILQARQQKEVVATVTPPPNAEPGGHYATIFFQPLVPSLQDESIAAYIGSKVGVLNLMIVKGDIQQELAVSSLTAPTFSQHGPIELTLGLQNTGNVHLMPTGTIEIYNALGKLVETLPLPPSLVLPKTTKNIHVTWGSKKHIGYYTAKASIVYGTDNKSLQSRLSRMVILPWLNLILLSVAGIVIGFVGWRGRGRWRKVLQALLHKERI